MTYRIFHRPWKVRRPFYYSLIFELLGTVGVLVLSGIAQTGSYRGNLWQIGYDNGFNSNPAMTLYAYANHVPLPTIPFVWSNALTNLNVAISVLSLFLLISKMIATIMKVFFPVCGLVISLTMSILYIVSLWGQCAPDYADAAHPSPSPWYLSKGCAPAKPYKAVQSCVMAQACVGVTAYMIILYMLNFALSVWSMWPNKMLDLEDHDGSDSDSDVGMPAPSQKQWEMQPQTPRFQQPIASPRFAPSLASPRFAPSLASPRFTSQQAGGGSHMMTAPGPAHMASPFTPRTQAFHTLDRKLPLRTN